ncbi:BPSS1780 family membrane protein [Polaromonas jejuensis]|uniref:BPSS1780 family membrane protein n=1 Tax=Polaromonas jejuensis TaxID=457502 RepID=A0ABW0QDU6_9BURK|nr:BPSS1780 family membrane protein [Polaromonas jejuensis]
MKLNIVPARTGLTWVRLGITTFIRQPLAMSGLFFMFMALLSIATLVPFVGAALALALLPAATLGLMAATQEATKGKFPMPSILISAFRAGQQRVRAMMVLGALYAVGFLALMGVSALFDGGQFASLYLLGGQISEELVQQGNFQLAMWVALALYLPLSLMFWHAPALVHWHGITPVKSLFFSFMACYKNFGALTVFGLAWIGVFVAAAALVSLVAIVLGNPMFAAVAMFPMVLVIVAMFFTSIYFTFRDSFLATPDDSLPDHGLGTHPDLS